MSRGLSKQQRCILGLAYSVRCAFHGGTFVEYSEPIQPPDEAWRCQYVLATDDRLPDYQLAVGLHYLEGLPFSDGIVARHTKYGVVTQDNPGIFKHSKESRCAKASLSRSANTLLRQGYLAWQKGEHWYHYGYVLAPKAYDIGKQHRQEVELESVVALLIGLNTNASRWESGYQAKYYLRFTEVSQ